MPRLFVLPPVVTSCHKYVGQLWATNPSTARPRTGVDRSSEAIWFPLVTPGNSEGCVNVDFAWNAALFPLPGLFDSLPIYTNPSTAMEAAPSSPTVCFPHGAPAASTQLASGWYS